MAADAVVPSHASLPAAHARMLADKSLQFRFDTAQPPKPPAWLEPLLRLLDAIAPALGYLFWGALVVVVLLIVFVVVREILHRRRGDRIAPEPEAAPVDLTPAPEKARALLDDADRLAAQGLFAEAVHLLLLRSVDDIEAKRPSTVTRSMTSRDIAGLSVLPEAARAAFWRIAEVVERSFFGGRPVDADGYGRCREAYEAFAFPRAWS